ncbi:glutathione S-transferase omega-1-like [Amphiura filiformis]|uniref:glutathione S-transferase omega-1-like n=1 Tax=Amphiura filiformis TaxID=82378 RepID=UPI003B2282FC
MQSVFKILFGVAKQNTSSSTAYCKYHIIFSSLCTIYKHNRKTMSAKHLKKGEPCPPLDPGVLRIYSCIFCPFSERARLVLHAKNIPHELVNVNLWTKPEWFADKNPSAAVPVLEQDGKIVYDSRIVADYLDELYPDQRPLYSKDAYQKAQDKMVIAIFEDKVHGAFWKSRSAKGKDQEAKEKFLTGLGKLDEKLKDRGTNFFGGDQPGMVDFVMWPFFARLKSYSVLGENADLPDSLPVLQAWKARMMEDPTVKSTILPDKSYSDYDYYYRNPNTTFNVDDY